MRILVRNETKIHRLETLSQLNQRKLSFAVIEPPNNSSFQRSSVLYLLHGLFGDYDNWLTNTDLSFYMEKFNFLVVCPTGENGWYVDCEKDGQFFESYLIEELMPEVERDFVGQENKLRRAIAGLSMGGYGSFKLAFKYPEKFVFAAAMSGAFHAAELFEGCNENDWKTLRPSILQVFGESESSPVRKNNDLFKLVANFPRERILELPFFYFDCGTEDSFLPTSLRLAKLFRQKGISHRYHQKAGGHDWLYWNEGIKNILMLTAQVFLTS
jgi:putative tributyrin esterase